jgi:hypothetical protein
MFMIRAPSRAPALEGRKSAGRAQKDAIVPKARSRQQLGAIVARILKSNLLELTGAVVMFVGSRTEIQAI